MIRFVTNRDIGEWLELAKEAEPLFGKMAGDPEFNKAIEACISDSSAICVTDTDNGVAGIVAVNKENNEIAWLAVKNSCRKKGYGRQLAEAALASLDTHKPIYVQTFAPHVEEGKPARKLYLQFGFKDDKDGGKNPAGIDTVVMRLG